MNEAMRDARDARTAFRAAVVAAPTTLALRALCAEPAPPALVSRDDAIRRRIVAETASVWDTEALQWVLHTPGTGPRLVRNPAVAGPWEHLLVSWALNAEASASREATQTWQALLDAGRLAPRSDAMRRAWQLAVQRGGADDYSQRHRGAVLWLLHPAAPADGFLLLLQRLGNRDYFACTVLAHPHVPPAVQDAVLARPAVTADQFAQLAQHRRAQIDPVFRRALRARLAQSPTARPLVALLVREPPAEFARHWRTLFALDPRAAADVLHDAHPAQLATLTREDATRLAQHDDPEVHRAALRVLPHLRPRPAVQRPPVRR